MSETPIKPIREPDYVYIGVHGNAYFWFDEMVCVDMDGCLYRLYKQCNGKLTSEGIAVRHEEGSMCTNEQCPGAYYRVTIQEAYKRWLIDIVETSLMDRQDA